MIRGEYSDGPINEYPRYDELCNMKYLGAYVVNELVDFANKHIMTDTTTPGNGAHDYRFTTWVEDLDRQYGTALVHPSAENIVRTGYVSPVFYTVDRYNKQVIESETVRLNIPRNLDDPEAVIELDEEVKNIENIYKEKSDLVILHALIQKSIKAQEKGIARNDRPIYISLAGHKPTLDFLAQEYSENEQAKAEKEEMTKREWMENWSNFEDLCYELLERKSSFEGGALAYESNDGENLTAMKLTGFGNTIKAAEIIRIKKNGELEDIFYVFSNNDQSVAEDNYDNVEDYDKHFNIVEFSDRIRNGARISQSTFDSYRPENENEFNDGIAYEGNRFVRGEEIDY